MKCYTSTGASGWRIGLGGGGETGTKRLCCCSVPHTSLEPGVKDSAKWVSMCVVLVKQNHLKCEADRCELFSTIEPRLTLDRTMRKIYRKCHRGGNWRVPGMYDDSFLVFVENGSGLHTKRPYFICNDKFLMTSCSPIEPELQLLN